MKPAVSRVGSSLSLYAHGVLQSRLNLAERHEVQVPYLSWIATAAESYLTHHRHAVVFHLGGGLMSLPLRLSQSTPSAQQRVYEIEDEILSCLPVDILRGTNIVLKIADGRDAIRSASPATLGIIVHDAIDIFSSSAALVSEELFGECQRALDPAGLMLMNVATVSEDHADRVAAGMQQRFDFVGEVSQHRRLADASLTNSMLFATDSETTYMCVLSSIGRVHQTLQARNKFVARPYYSEARGDSVTSAIDERWLYRRVQELASMQALTGADDPYYRDFEIVSSQLREVWTSRYPGVPLPGQALVPPRGLDTVS